MDIKYTDKNGFVRSVEETLNDLLTHSTEFSNNHMDTKLQIRIIQQENVILREQIITTQKDLSDTKTLILKLQDQQNDNHMTSWGVVKRLFKFQKPSNITTSEVDLTKE